MYVFIPLFISELRSSWISVYQRCQRWCCYNYVRGSACTQLSAEFSNGCASGPLCCGRFLLLQAFFVGAVWNSDPKTQRQNFGTPRGSRYTYIHSVHVHASDFLNPKLTDPPQRKSDDDLRLHKIKVQWPNIWEVTTFSRSKQVVPGVGLTVSKSRA